MDSNLGLKVPHLNGKDVLVDKGNYKNLLHCGQLFESAPVIGDCRHLE